MRRRENERDEVVDLLGGEAAFERGHLDQGFRVDIAMLRPPLEDPRAHVALAPVPHHPGAARPPGNLASLGPGVWDGLAAAGPMAPEAPHALGDRTAAL